MNMENLTNHLSNVSGKDLIRAFGLGPTARDYFWPALGIFVAGGAVGTLFALLFAPKSGEELRSNISEGVRARLEGLEERFAKWEISQEGNGRDHDAHAHAD